MLTGMTLYPFWASLVAQIVKNPPAMQETWVQSLGWEDLLEKRLATHSSILAWRIPWTEEPGGLQSMGLQRVGHDWVTKFQFYPVSFVVIEVKLIDCCLWATHDGNLGDGSQCDENLQRTSLFPTTQNLLLHKKINPSQLSSIEEPSGLHVLTPNSKQKYFSFTKVQLVICSNWCGI